MCFVVVAVGQVRTVQYVWWTTKLPGTRTVWCELLQYSICWHNILVFDSLPTSRQVTPRVTSHYFLLMLMLMLVMTPLLLYIHMTKTRRIHFSSCSCFVPSFFFQSLCHTVCACLPTILLTWLGLWFPSFLELIFFFIRCWNMHYCVCKLECMSCSFMYSTVCVCVCVCVLVCDCMCTSMWMCECVCVCDVCEYCIVVCIHCLYLSESIHRNKILSYIAVTTTVKLIVQYVFSYIL